MIENIYLSMILIGATIGVVLAILWHQARKASHINLALIRLNEQLAFDAPAFLIEAWTLLSQSGLRGMAWRLDWFGVVKEGRLGIDAAGMTLRQIEVGEMKVAVTFYQRPSRGERRYFEETLIETFLLLLRTDLLIKAGATDATLSQMSKLNLFLQHDMKNIAQFVQLMSDQLAAIPPGKEQKVLDYLRRATPLIRNRADRIVSTLTLGVRPAEATRVVNLRALLMQLCDLYGLGCTIEGDADLHASGKPIDTVLDNILKNYHDLAMVENAAHFTMAIVIRNNADQIDIDLKSDDAPHVHAIERLFEPFWSSNAGGLGIGLYQAKQILEMQGGSLVATQDDAKVLHFHIRCMDVFIDNKQCM